MIKDIIQAFEQKYWVQEIDPELRKKSIKFYKYGFKPQNITSSQMSAVRELLRSKESLEEVKKSVRYFINKQLERLSKKEDTGSWLNSSADQDGKCLGDILKEWIKNEKYLNKKSFDENTRLTIVRRFWNLVCDQYNYEKTCKESMFEEVK